MTTPVLEVRSLTVDAPSTTGAPVRIVDGVDLQLERGERVALVGESGSGKSVTARAVLGLDEAMTLGGSIRYDGQELVGASGRDLRRVRGREIAMVFQDALGALNPLMTIGQQICEPLRARGLSRVAAHAEAVRTLDELGVADAQRRMRSYPHEFSGGMRQRVVLAIALVGGPQVLIADEPTTALDVRVQAQVMRLLSDVAEARGLAVLFITHDVGVVGDFADRTVVMYAGKVVEENSVAGFFGRPQHPYTRGLLAAVPRVNSEERLRSMPGTPPRPAARPAGCVFVQRCAFATERCSEERPELRLGRHPGAAVACHLAPAGEPLPESLEVAR